MKHPQTDDITHLPGIHSRFIDTNRLNIHYLDTLTKGDPVVFLHGNASSSTFWEETMLELPPDYRGVAPDLRGYGLTDRSAIIDARRGTGDWIDDIHVLLEVLGIGPFHLVGHSMGGMIGWGVLSDPRFKSRIHSATLVAPGPPCGFGGLQGPSGSPNNPDFSGSGAGLAHPHFAELIRDGERGISDPLFSPRAVMNRLFWKPPFRPAREEDLLSAVLQVHTGDKQFPGDVSKSEYWPGFAPGRYGAANAMSGRYNRNTLERVIQMSEKPPLLVIMGEDDPVISDNSTGDVATLGKKGTLPGWPGDEVFPPQPFRSQIKTTVDRYQAAGGQVQWFAIPNCGHTPYLEQAPTFRRVFHSFIALDR